MIGEPLGFGLNHYGIGVRQDVPTEVVTTMDYWLNRLMTCSPGECGNASLATMYPKVAGTGRDCGYVQFPVDQDGLKPQVVIGIVVGAVAFVAVICSLVYWFKLKKQEKRFKKRYVACCGGCGFRFA